MPFEQVLPQVKKLLRFSFLVCCLVGSVKLGHGDFSHAMILDNIRDGQFVFKNTDSRQKKFTIPVDHQNAPDEFFFVHIEWTNQKTETGGVNQAA